MTRRRRAAAVGAGVALLGLVLAGVYLGPKLRSPEQAAALAAPPSPSLVTVNAEQRVLAEPIVLRGQITPGPSTPVLAAATAVGETSVITKVAVTVGQTLGEGDVVVARADEPMFALVLPFPLYRDIVGGDRGADVDAVQTVLRRLGYGAPRSGVLDSGTQQALRRLYSAKGFVAPPGNPEAVKQLPAAQSAVAGAEAAYAAAPGDAAAKAALDLARRNLAETQLAVGPGVKRSSVLTIDRAGRTVSAVKVAVGSVLTDPKAPLIELDGQAAFVKALASQEQAQQVRAGQAATVSDDASGAKVSAAVAAIGEKPVTTSDGVTGFEISVAFTGAPLADGAGRALRIDILVADNPQEVLAIPVTAVFSRPDGKTFATVVRPDGSTFEVNVATGRVAGGWVEVVSAQPEGLAAGAAVVVGKDFGGVIDPKTKGK